MKFDNKTNIYLFLFFILYKYFIYNNNTFVLLAFSKINTHIFTF